MQLQNLITFIYHDFGERKAQACDNDFGDSDISHPTRIIQRLSIVTVRRVTGANVQ
jgi:hypothetical protein